MKGRGGITFLWLLFLSVVAMPAVASAQVSVYAEGAYTAADLAVYIYADITGSPLCSFGVSLNYNSSNLTVNTDPNKTNFNRTVWYFGSPFPNNIACPNCVTDTGTKIVFIGGKLDTNPGATQGVIGPRMLLAKATFSRKPNTDTNFGISLSLGKDHPPFDNFVTTTGTPVDLGATFAVPVIAKAGDANKDGNINALDAGLIRNIFFGGGAYAVFADCNLDGSINALDAGCVRDKFFSGQ